MSEDNRKYPGRLCSNCRHASFCTFPKDLDKPSFYCEEFEIEEPPTIRIAGEERPKVAEPYVAEAKESAKFIGLCGDCENRQTCVFPKPEGGVWHCEEYR